MQIRRRGKWRGIKIVGELARESISDGDRRGEGARDRRILHRDFSTVNANSREREFLGLLCSAAALRKDSDGNADGRSRAFATERESISPRKKERPSRRLQEERAGRRRTVVRTEREKDAASFVEGGMLEYACARPNSNDDRDNIMVSLFEFVRPCLNHLIAVEKCARGGEERDRDGIIFLTISGYFIPQGYVG